MLGYIPDPVDNRDWQWRTFYGEPRAVSARVSLESLFGPSYDQGQTSTCVCQTLAALKRLHEWAESGHWLTFDAAELYRRCKEVDGIAAEGTTPRTAFGIATTDGMLADDGHRYTISGYARLSSAAHIQHALDEGFPVLLGVPIDVPTLSAYRAGELLPVPAGAHSGHCMLAVGYDQQLAAFRVRNSWGPGWGDHGHLWMPYDYLASSAQFDAWTCVDAPGGSA